MSNIDLILKDIEDRHIRENFFRLNRFINDQVIFDGDFTLFDVYIDKAIDPYTLKHGLTFIPEDIITLHVEGDFNFYFKYQDFDRENIYIRSGGPVRLRFLAGRLRDSTRKSFNETLPLVPIGTGPGAPPAVSTPRLIAVFDTDVATTAGDLVIVDGVNHVTKISSNSSLVLPNGIFGVGYSKPTATTIEVLFTGITPASYAGLSAGQPIFVSTAGVPTHTVPTTGMVQQIGFAVSASEFFVHLMLPTERA